jgi:hypothetical protein
MKHPPVSHAGSWDPVAHYGLRVVKVEFLQAHSATRGSATFRANVDGDGACEWVVVRLLDQLALVGKATNEHMFWGGW